MRKLILTILLAPILLAIHIFMTVANAIWFCVMVCLGLVALACSLPLLAYNKLTAKEED